MRFNEAVATALYSSAILLGNVRADDAEDVDSSSTTIEEATTTSILEKPTFTVSLCQPATRLSPILVLTQRLAYGSQSSIP